MNELLMGLLILIAIDLGYSSVQTEKNFMRQRTVAELTLVRVAALFYVAVLIWAVVTIA